MDGLMMERPLLIRDIAERAERLFGDREIVSVTHGDVERSSYAEVVERARRVASSLQRLGVEAGDRVATFGWNSRRHLELYLAVPAMGAVLHTLNIRLFEDDLRFAVRATAGRVVPLVDFRIDEEAGGELQVRGPWVARGYYNDPEGAKKFTEDGWLRTGDVAAEQPGGYLKLVDRTKDLVKSGGEWISSVELENHVMAHPDVVEAAVVAVADEHWGERPCACIVRRPESDLTADEVRTFLGERVAKWWVPERIEFIPEVPKTSVGKFDKKVLRAQLADGG